MTQAERWERGVLVGHTVSFQRQIPELRGSFDHFSLYFLETVDAKVSFAWERETLGKFQLIYNTMQHFNVYK